MRLCKNCHEQFDHPEHFTNFLANFKDVMGLPEAIPPPTLCPRCRAQRRFCFRNEMNLCRRQCSRCKKDIVAMYDANAPFPVQCPECMWSDSWDAIDYGRTFDFSRNFFDQYKDLMNVVPRVSVVVTPDNTGCDYCNYTGGSKNCYLTYGSIHAEDCYYGSPYYSKNCVDVLVSRHCEYSYELVDCQNLHTSAYCQDCENSHDIAFCYDCKNCSDCIGCVGLRNKQYCIFNEQLTELEYKERKASMPLWDSTVRADSEERLGKLQAALPHRFMRASKVENVTGDYIYESNNTHESFFVEKCEDSGFLGQTIDMKDCYDANFTENDELLYNYLGMWKVQRSLCSLACHNSHDFYYSDFCNSCSHVFGCIGLKNKQYVILNKVYSKDEYVVLRDKIILHMKETGEWGEYFPPSISPFAFNESAASQYYPLPKDEVIARGWRWRDDAGGTIGKETISHEQIPDDISKVGDGIMNQILACKTCNRNYKLIKQELAFYKKLGYGIPRNCPACRHVARLSKRNPRTLWMRQCDCALDSHGHSVRCETTFNTSYSSGRAERIFCESCYQKEVV